MITLVLLLGSQLLTANPVDVAADEVAVWTWVQGQLEDDAQQEEYTALANRIFSSYQSRNKMQGRLVLESELQDEPTDHVVYIGPLEAFQNTEWLSPPFESVEPGAVSLAGVEFKDPHTGIYYNDADGSRRLYTGLSFAGFKEIFTVPTGMYACTVTVRGQVAHEGDLEAGRLRLQTLDFLPPYPDLADVSELGSSAGAVTCSSVYADDAAGALSPDFAQRLDDLVENRSALFVGESHWNLGVDTLFREILEHLLSTQDVRSVFLEINFSFTGHYNHYVHIADDAEAQRFLEEELHPLVSARNVIELLELLRVWNQNHPAQQVSIATLDMEWGADLVIQRILEPYFRALDPDFKIADPYRSQPADWETNVARMRTLLAQAANDDMKRAYSFLTPQYLGEVLTSLVDTIALENFDVDRQRAIARNITVFNGDLFDEGLAVFKGGGYHAVKAQPSAGEVYRDAAFLQHVFEPTKGRVATIMLLGLRYGFANIADTDLSKMKHSATSYNRMVYGFQHALGAGGAHSDAIYLIAGAWLSAYDRLVVRAGYLLKQSALWIRAADPTELDATIPDEERVNRFADYDAFVYVLRSQLTRTRPRVLEER